MINFMHRQPSLSIMFLFALFFCRCHVQFALIFMLKLSPVAVAVLLLKATEKGQKCE